MEKEIFKNLIPLISKFKTRSGKLALYVGQSKWNPSEMLFIIQGETQVERFMEDGRFWATPGIDTDWDIVEPWDNDEISK